MKKTILALTLGLLIGSTGTAVAATSEPVQAIFAKFTFKIDGKRSTEIEPLVHEGSAFLSVKDVATLFGYRIVYHTENRTIEFLPEPTIGNKSETIVNQ